LRAWDRERFTLLGGSPSGDYNLSCVEPEKFWQSIHLHSPSLMKFGAREAGAEGMNIYICI
jgi:hypothetical protein